MTQDFRAARLLGGGYIDVIAQRPSQPAPGQVRVRISQCGVCASNVPPWQGRPWFSYPLDPGAPGHEANGQIEAIGDGVEDWAVGDRVAYIGERGFAEQENVPASSLLRLPEEAGNDFLGEPLACAMNIFRRSAIKPGDVVAIVGVGFLGRLLIPLALDTGATVVAIARRTCQVDDRVALVIGEESAPIVQEVQKLTGDQLCDVVIEATGAQQPLQLAAELTRIRGKLVIAGYHQEMRQVNMQLWNWRGLDVINAHERDPQVYLEGMRLALEAVRTGKWHLDGVISHRFPLDGLAEALRCTAERPQGFTKAVIAL
jgi:threonine dehydrogenase-like Zn-dependent dehydrogenase